MAKKVIVKKPMMMNPNVATMRPPKPKTPLAKLHSKMRDMSNMVEAVNGYGPQPPLDQVQLPPQLVQAATALHKHLDQTMGNAQKNLLGPLQKSTPTNVSPFPPKGLSPKKGK